MPELTWTGKSAVKNHHDTVPFRLLHPDPKLSLPSGTESVSEKNNLLVQGDNLLALKALLPYYAGQVKCIYIDPPYNTGNEGWVYNDNVNSPEMKEWIDKTVGKEAEDLNRHDKWLCMMYPRLQILKQFLREDGTIFISLDDNAIHYLRYLMDEIFGARNFVASIIWQKRTSPDARTLIGPAHDYVLVYAKSAMDMKLNKIPISSERGKDFKNPDDDPKGPWASVDLTGQTGHATKDQFYTIVAPNGKSYPPPSGRCWALAEATYKRLAEEGKIWFGKDGNARPRLKRYLSEIEGTTSWTWWPNTEVGHNQEATKELNEIMETSGLFETPKPTRLLKRILQIATKPGDLVLDSFAGSGTTGNAVLALNKEDGGNRKFILVEMDSHIAPNITAERLRRVALGYGEMPGLGGGFVYCTLGEPLLDETGAIRSSVTWVDLARHVFFSETGVALTGEVRASGGFLGVHNATAYYLLWNGDGTAALTPASLKKLPPHPDGTTGKRVIFAESCLLSSARQETEGIIFKQVPYEVKTR